MEKYINPDSDGRFYERTDLVRANCHDCMGCYKCCTGMGDSIVLDPYDMYLLRTRVGLGLEVLLQKGYVSLGNYEGMILPHIEMGRENQCSFLDENKRCSIHENRPGICRLFPLGRNYSEGKMNYILLTKACENKNRSKIEVQKWLGIFEAKEYHEFVIAWHYFRKEMTKLFQNENEDQIRDVNMYLLNVFFVQPDAVFSKENPETMFYEWFREKLQKIKSAFAID